MGTPVQEPPPARTPVICPCKPGVCFLLDIDKKYSFTWDASECGIPSEAFPFAERNFIENLIDND